jgi:hypothetical protein
MTAVQLLAGAFSFLAAVISLDVFWVRTTDELRGGDIGGALRKRSWLNALVALGAAGAVVLLVFWVGACSNGAF